MCAGTLNNEGFYYCCFVNTCVEQVITVTSEVALLLQSLLQSVHCDEKAVSL